jgi:mono/diheme cytochrome c family protein
MRMILITFTAVTLCAVQATAADAKAGGEVFAKSCKSCHGADGTPNPAIAKMMKVDMKNLGSADVQAQSDGDIAKIIADGKGKMKPVKTVSGPAVDNVVAYVRTLKSN